MSVIPNLHVNEQEIVFQKNFSGAWHKNFIWPVYICIIQSYTYIYKRLNQIFYIFYIYIYIYIYIYVYSLQINLNSTIK